MNFKDLKNVEKLQENQVNILQNPKQVNKENFKTFDKEKETKLSTFVILEGL